MLLARAAAIPHTGTHNHLPADLLKTLKERSDANRAGRKKDLEDRYCRRQAEIGAGDCAGLRWVGVGQGIKGSDFWA